ncbi:uncharacterized protein L3040_006961 [Drepanopeziza brunnea f. sp. 'multigermtubi']|uniref:Uncharacterized protein n=1 Tax=Marssonina brunnea f. sp. multigermtubi (strain MB_m1) TaxID=1072389 RepID=K1WIX7_MARBU|nr:uncharacterized protein MBM_09035 [Drepanopeziza brunnea f. sp. 'multigermtubi' MB_m1]EKD12806.1 hypothetical protein MBM_09035 [Drepanopeziza brunnea f. sp. 'multigermtubi' MB_m1]KAJ5038090.1 hypothetical protein L3040_006961 [Drepanopeziza brunnea f. sp. 'multigermtubi']
MSKATNTKLMDTEPGGENTQYESQATFMKSPKKSTGQFGNADAGEPNEADCQAAAEKAQRGEKTAENIRYGQAISEHGFGGETVMGGSGAPVGEGQDSAAAATEQARRAQGYGGGSDVGA